MFQNTFCTATHLAFPDVCNTPSPSGVTPMTYPNTALSSNSIPSVFNQFIEGMPIHNQLTTAYVSNGDEAGASGGVTSGTIDGPGRHILGSTKVFATAMPVVKMLSPTDQNGVAGNAVGLTLSPSQVKVMVLT